MVAKETSCLVIKNYYVLLSLVVSIHMKHPCLLQSSSGQKYKTTSVEFLNSSTVGVSNTPGGGGPGGVVNAKHLFLFKVGVGLLTAGRGPSGGVSCHGASDVAVARHLTLEWWPVVSWLWFSQLIGRRLWVFAMVLIQRKESSFSSSLLILNPFGASLMYTDSFTFLS